MGKFRVYVKGDVEVKEEKYIKYGLFLSIIIVSGPILWLFINLYDKNYDDIVLNIVFVIIGIALVLFNLRNYLRVYNKKYNLSLEILMHIVSFIFFIVLIVVMVIGIIVFYMSIAFVQEKLFIKGKYIMYLIKSPYSYLVFVILIMVAIRIKSVFSKKEKKYHKRKIFYSIKFEILIIITLVYLVLTNRVVVTEDGIYDYSFYNLKGTRYSFSDVEYVNTGFIIGGRNEGEFFYNIQLKNGKKLKLAHPSMTYISDKYDNDTWQEYVDIDKYIMKNGGKKESSEDGSQYVKMDSIYIDKLLEVIKNK